MWPEDYLMPSYIKEENKAKAVKQAKEEVKTELQTEYDRGYQQALQDINKPRQVIMENWCPSECPRCKGTFDEDCDDGYYDRAYALERCPHCGQKLKWYD